jgi:hypothetical protein
MKSRGVEQDGVSAVLPRCLEAKAYAAVGVEREALLGERRPREVAAEPREARAVTAVERNLRVHIDPEGLGQRLARRGHDAHRLNELGGSLPRRRAEELQVAGRGGVARGEHGLLRRELVWRVVRALE